MITIENVSRRGFLQGMFSAGAFVLCARILPEPLWAAATDAPGSVDATAFHPSVFVGIHTDGMVYIVAHRSEMGNGVRTSLPRILADELDADWSRVHVMQADGDAEYGSQDTDGSHSVREFFDVLREAGATARLMLVRAAAQQWGIPESQCVADPVHVVSDKNSARKFGYGELASLAAKQPVPKKEELTLKSPKEWRYIGKPAPGFDVAEICSGKPLFGMDVRVDGMLYAAIAHPPVLGGKVKSLDDSATLKVIGVKKTVAIDPFKPPHGFQPLGGVAVIADNTFAAFKGRKQLKIDWDNGSNASYNSADYKKELQQTARQPGKVVHTVGDPDAEFAKGGRIVEAEYFAPHLAHASMEPPVAVADVQGEKVRVWSPTQDPQGVQEEVAKALGLKKENVVCHVTFLGGGFGRKSKPDYAVEAAVLSKKTGKPVKVIWSREDDIKFDYYHSVAAMYMKAALDENGRPKAWLQRSVFPPIGSTFKEGEVYGGAGEMSMGWNVVPFDSPELPLGKRAGRRPRTHRLAAVGGQHLSRVRGAVVRQRTRARRQPRSLRLPAHPHRIGPRARRWTAGASGSRREISLRHGAPATRGRTRGRESELGQNEIRQRDRPGHRRAPQLLHLRCDGGRGGGRRPGCGAHSPRLYRSRCGNRGQS